MTENQLQQTLDRDHNILKDFDFVATDTSAFNPKQNPAQTDWSESAKEALNSLPKRWTRGLLYFLLVFAVVVVPWSLLSKVDETGTGRGRLEPKDAATRLEAATAGTVTKIYVREGQSVQKGEVLMELEADSLRNDLKQAQTKLNGQMNRYTQLGTNRNQIFMAIATQRQQNQAQAMEKLAQIDRANQTFGNSRSSAPVQKMEKLAQVEQAQRALQSARLQAKLANDRLAKDEKEVNRYRQLWKQGVMPEVKVKEIERISDDSRRQLTLAFGEIQQSEKRVQEQKSAYQKLLNQTTFDRLQAQSHLKEQRSNQISLLQAGKLSVLKGEEELKNVESQTTAVNTEITQSKSQIADLQRQIAQRVLRAPIGGTVLQMPYKQPKSFVQNGQLIAQVAPQGASLVLKTQMPIQESGFLKVGMPVKVKFDAYPFQDYGIVSGQIQWISPDSKVTESGGNKVENFEVNVVLDRGYIQGRNKRINLQMGQTATAEIVVRQRQVVDFILDPFKQLQKNGIKL